MRKIKAPSSLKDGNPLLHHFGTTESGPELSVCWINPQTLDSKLGLEAASFIPPQYPPSLMPQPTEIPHSLCTQTPSVVFSLLDKIVQLALPPSRVPSVSFPLPRPCPFYSLCFVTLPLRTEISYGWLPLDLYLRSSDVSSKRSSLTPFPKEPPSRSLATLFFRNPQQEAGLDVIVYCSHVHRRLLCRCRENRDAA